MGRKAEVSLYRLFNVEGTHSNGGRPSRLTRDVSIRQTLGDRSRMPRGRLRSNGLCGSNSRRPDGAITSGLPTIHAVPLGAYVV